MVVQPALTMVAFGISAEEYIFTPLFICQLRSFCRTRNMRFTVTGKLGLITITTIGAVDNKHSSVL